MVERRHVSPGLIPVLAMLAFLTLGSGDLGANFRPVVSIISASAGDTTQPPIATDPTVTGTVEAEVIPAIFTPASAPEVIPAIFVPSTGLDTQAEMGSTPIGTIDEAPVVVPRDMGGLAASVEKLIASSGASVGVTVVELGGPDPMSWSVNGGSVFTAASTYKLAALMLEAQNIATGKTDPNGAVCFQDTDYEEGWFADYAPGDCFTRNELARRAGTYSDNTAGHMLVRDVGGAEMLDAWAASFGATSSAFFVGNTTTSADLAALWVAEAQGKLGGAAAQAWLYPYLMNTRTESGVPAGVAGVAVVHKTGTIDQVDNDAALVTNGPDGAYILVVMTDGLGGQEGWQLIAGISASVNQFEASRPAAAT
jgi:beta-lactamase class A